MTQDWKERHKEFCHKEADKRKVKIGSELRRADEMETLEEIFADMEAAENSGIKEELGAPGAMKKMFQKKKSKVKVYRLLMRSRIWEIECKKSIAQSKLIVAEF